MINIVLITTHIYDPDEGKEKIETHGTAGMVNILQMAKDLDKENGIYVKVNDKKFYYSDLKAGNDGQDLTLDDVKWVSDHDGYPAGEDQYCVKIMAPTVTPTFGLTKNGKKWIAKNFGKKIGDRYCFVDSGIEYYYYNPYTGQDVYETGGTGRC